MFNKPVAKDFWFCVIKGRSENYLNEKEAFPLQWLLLLSCKLVMFLLQAPWAVCFLLKLHGRCFLLL